MSSWTRHRPVNLTVLTSLRARLQPVARHPYVGGAVLLALVLALRAWVQWVGPLPGDHYAAYHYYTNPADPLSGVADVYQQIASPYVALMTLLIGGLALWWRTSRREAVGFVVAFGAVVVDEVLKRIFGPTPLWELARHGAGANYPSGHVTFVVAVFGYLAWVAVRRRAPDLLLACAIVILGMGPARIVSGAHLVSDVIGGYLLGAGWLLLVATTVKSRLPDPSEPVALRALRSRGQARAPH